MAKFQDRIAAEKALEDVPLSDTVSSANQENRYFQHGYGEEKSAAVVGLEPSSSEKDREDVEGQVEDVIHHPANKDDILTHTIHLEDDPSLPALTFRTWFVGKS